KAEFPELGAELERRIGRQLPSDWEGVSRNLIQEVDQRADSIATRKASQICLNAFGPVLPELLGGSADLTGSNLTMWSGSKPITRQDPSGSYIYYGVREFAMSAVMNGIALHGGFIPYGGTFLVFSDYARSAVRMAALMRMPTIFIYSHDSIGLGEDGPTHQAVEQAATLRLIPQTSVWRPCDTVETAAAWRLAIERRDGPTCLLLTRQGVPHQTRAPEQIENIERGGYVLSDCDATPDAIIIATGSEVGLAVAAAQQLNASGHRVRVVSMPCTDKFDAQPTDYQESVLPTAVSARIAVEAGRSDYWRKYVGLQGEVVGLDRFGESAPAADVFRYFGFTPDRVVSAVLKALHAT
ncbi:MAG: transketolase, partial [Gammaproteobacteria bacterium]|nr:transketolase [Gammaproteobacteria bacterium]